MGDITASLAFVALHHVSRLDIRKEAILIGSAHLLSLLIERALRIEENAKRAEEELKLIKLVRAEDAKANEKVVAIFATHEQSWIAEKKSLKLQIQALSTHLQSLKSKHEETVSNFSFRVTEAECQIKIKDYVIEEETKKVGLLEKEVEELKKAIEMHKKESILVTEKMENDLEQKDKMLSALLRKSKVDNEEKQVMLKEVKMSKAKKKQAELEMEKWKNKWELRNKKGSRSSYSKEVGSSDELRSSKNVLFEHEDFGTNEEKVIEAIKFLNKFPSEELLEEFETHDIQSLEDWVKMETEKYTSILEQKHFTEIEAFTEQMRLKDEKLEAFRWRLISKDIESKRMQSHIEELQERLSQLKEENLKVGSLFLDNGGQMKCLKDHYSSTTTTNADIMVIDVMSTDSHDNSVMSLEEAKSIDSYGEEESKSIIILTNLPKQEKEEEIEVTTDSTYSPMSNKLYKDDNVVKVLAPMKSKDRKMDIQALGVSYKIKRLKQQLLMLEKLAGMKEIKPDDNKQQLKGIGLVIHLLNKQVKRFQSLEEKTDDLCERMNDHAQGGERRDSKRGKQKNRVLENFLEETFQLQRYMVATGQKLVDMQSKITYNINGSNDGLDESICFNTEQFSDVINNLFKEIQRGLEVRIARIIGDIEGTLACDGIRQI